MENPTTRLDRMKELNELLQTNYNWSRLNKLDLERLVKSIKNKEDLHEY